MRYVYSGDGQSSSTGTATVKMLDTSKIKTTMSSILPLLFHRPPVCACGHEECCVCENFQSVKAADGPVPYARRQPSVSRRLVATAIRTLCGESNLFHHRYSCGRAAITVHTLFLFLLSNPSFCNIIAHSSLSFLILSLFYHFLTTSWAHWHSFSKMELLFVPTKLHEAFTIVTCIIVVKKCTFHVTCGQLFQSPQNICTTFFFFCYVVCKLDHSPKKNPIDITVCDLQCSKQYWCPEPPALLPFPGRGITPLVS